MDAMNKKHIEDYVRMKGFWSDNPQANCKGKAVVDGIAIIEELQAENDRLTAELKAKDKAFEKLTIAQSLGEE